MNFSRIYYISRQIVKCKLLVNVCRCEVLLAGQPAKRGTVMYVGSYVLLFFIFI